MEHENRVKNMGGLAADVMARALNRQCISSDDPIIQSETTKTLARIAFRFAMKACPVPAWVYEILSTSHVVLSYRRRIALEREWNIPRGRVSPPICQTQRSFQSPRQNGLLTRSDPSPMIRTMNNVTSEVKHTGWWWKCLDCGENKPPGMSQWVKVDGRLVGRVCKTCNPQKAVKK